MHRSAVLVRNINNRMKTVADDINTLFLSEKQRFGIKEDKKKYMFNVLMFSESDA